MVMGDAGPEPVLPVAAVVRRPSMVKRAVSFPFKVLGRVLFTDFKLERDGTGVRIKVTEPVPLQAVEEHQVLATMTSTPPTELEALRTELKDVLDEQPNARRVLRHLAHVEAAIAEHGLTFATKVPSEVLKKALAQLEGLVTNWSDRGLASLRSKMSVSIIERSDASSGSAAPPAPSTGFSPSTLEAQTKLASDEFLDLARMYEGILSPEEIKAMKADFAPTRPPSTDGT